MNWFTKSQHHFFKERKPVDWKSRVSSVWPPSLNTAHDWPYLFFINFFFVTQKCNVLKVQACCVLSRDIMGEVITLAAPDCWRSWTSLEVMNSLKGLFKNTNNHFVAQRLLFIKKNRRTIKCTLHLNWISQVTVVFHDYNTFLSFCSILCHCHYITPPTI